VRLKNDFRLEILAFIFKSILIYLNLPFQINLNTGVAYSVCLRNFKLKMENHGLFAARASQFHFKRLPTLLILEFQTDLVPQRLRVLHQTAECRFGLWML
jgi:hypothetical protein